jgi:cysteinyl-tRNA synthetase
MGKSYNNVIKLSELFGGNHPILDQPYSPMTVRFFILQTHYRSTLDFSNEALQASERGLKRMWEAFGHLEKLDPVSTGGTQAGDADLDAQCHRLLDEAEESMTDDLNTAKVMANFFELVPVINSFRDGHVPLTSIRAETLMRLQLVFRIYLVDIFGLRDEKPSDSGRMDGVMQLLMDIRREARSRKDFATSDKIRNQLQAMGIQLKDEKDGRVSWTYL